MTRPARSACTPRRPLLALAGALIAVAACDESYIVDASPRVLAQDVRLGEVPVGSSVRTGLTVINGGPQASVLVIDSFDLEQDGDAFEMDTEGASIRGAQELTRPVVFAPRAAGGFAARVIIRSNATNDPEKAVTIAGTGVEESVCADCGAPPARRCATDDVLVLWDRAGRCDPDQCRYAARTVACEHGCEAGVCLGNRPPGAASVAITPDPAATGDDLTAQVLTDAADPEGHRVTYRYRWLSGATRTEHTSMVLTSSLTARGDVWRVVVTPTDGQADGPPADAEVTIANSPPTVGGVTIGPDPATASTVLSAEAAEPTDADGDLVTVRYRWTVGGAVVQDSDVSTLAAGTTARGQAVRVTATPHDGADDGPSVDSNVISIGNSPPAIASVHIDPAAGDESTVFTCTPAGWIDADGDSEQYFYRWFVGGATLAASAPRLTGASFGRGDSMRCEVTPTDGIEPGDPVTSSPVVVDNAPPSIGVATISPAAPRRGDVLSVRVSGWADLDGDLPRYRYAWALGGRLVGSGPTLDGSAFTRGDVITVTVTPFDGLATGRPVTSSPVVVDNTPPAVGAVSLAPMAPSTETDITATPTGWHDPDGDTEAYEYAWYVNAAVVPGATSRALPHMHFARGDDVYVRVTPHDGLHAGSAVSSATVTIANSPPSTPAIVIAPAHPMPDDDLTCSVTTPSTDADGDPIAYRHAWLTDNATTAHSSAVITSSVTSDGEQWTCLMTPSDGTDDGVAGSADITVGSSACLVQHDCGLNTNGLACPRTTTTTPSRSEVCRAGADCSGGGACRPLPGTASIGFCATAGATPVAGACSATPECVDGLCTEGVCRALCQTQSDCGSTDACAVVEYDTSDLGGLPGTRLTTVCRPPGALRPIGGVCSSSFNADSGLCATQHCDLPPWSASSGSVAAACAPLCSSSTDCGAQQVCGLVFNGLASSPPLSSTGEAAGRFYEAVLGCYTPYFRLNPLIWTFQPPGTGALGVTCDPTRADGRLACRNHLCAQFAPIRGRCTDYCDEDNDCISPQTPDWRCRFGELSLTGVFLQDYDIADITKFVLVGVCAP